MLNKVQYIQKIMERCKIDTTRRDRKQNTWRRSITRVGIKCVSRYSGVSLEIEMEINGSRSQKITSFKHHLTSMFSIFFFQIIICYIISTGKIS